jgi:hypothetical protein
MTYLIPREVVEILLHCLHPVWISKCILYHVWLNRRHKRVMFTKMSNLRSSGYPLLNVTKYGVDRVISLNCLVDSWVRRYFDVTIPASSTLPTIPTRPITRSRAKNIQQEVHVLLYEFQLNTNENFMLPKSCMLILLRFTQKEGQNISRAN